MPCRVPLDKSEGAVKDKILLGGALSTAFLPEKVEDQGSGNLTLNHLGGNLPKIVPPTIDSA